jgi:hypothetical protein
MQVFADAQARTDIHGSIRSRSAWMVTAPAQPSASTAAHHDDMTRATGSMASMPVTDSPAYMAIAWMWPVAAAPGGSPCPLANATR